MPIILSLHDVTLQEKHYEVLYWVKRLPVAFLTRGRYRALRSLFHKPGSVFSNKL